MTREPWPLGRKLSAVIVANVLAVLAIAFAIGWASYDGVKSRQENCKATIEALDVFTDALGATAEADEATVEAFRVAWHEPLDDCS